MKSFLSVCVFGLCLPLTIGAQNRCSRPLANHLFQQRKQQLGVIGSEAKRLQESVRFLQGNCLSARQVKELAFLFREEYNRLIIAESAYANVFDPENYYELYDVFSKFSLAIRLYDFINKDGAPVGVLPLPPSVGIDFTGFPPYQYPEYQNYVGVKNCSFPISESVFREIVVRIRTTQSETVRANALRQVVQSNCLAVNQVMRLVSSINNENTRLEVLCLVYPNIYDVENLRSALQVFQNQINIQQWEAFLQQHQESIVPGSPCIISNNEYATLVQVIRQENISENRLQVAKNLVHSYSCLSVEQVRGIVKLFDFDDDRLEMAKFLYDLTAGEARRQYFLVGNEFTFSSTRQELAKFIRLRAGR